MHRRRIVVTALSFGGLLLFGSAGVASCSRGIVPVGPPPPPTTTTTTVRPTTTTTVKPTTTTTTIVLADPLQEMISVAPNGAPAHYASADFSDGSEQPSMSADGRYVAFTSGATNLVPGDTNGLLDVFVRDRVTRTTQRLSVKSDGSEIGLGDTSPPCLTPPVCEMNPAGYVATISANGRYVTFITTAPLVPNDSGLGIDQYMVDRVTGTLELISVSATGTGLNSSVSSGSVSDDGRYVVFDSDAANLVGNDVDPTNNTFTDSAGHVITLFPLGRARDVFLRDRLLGTTTLLSAAPDGTGAQAYGPSITPDGRFVVFGAGGNLIAGGDESLGQVYVFATATGALEQEGYDASGNPIRVNSPFSISADGNVVAFMSSVAATPDAPTPTDPQAATPHIYARSRAQHTTVLVDQNGPNMTADREPWNSENNMSSDGRYVAYQCWCQRAWVGGSQHTGVYRTDLATGDTIEMDANQAGIAANDTGITTGSVGITADGTQVAYSSGGSNLIPGDTNNNRDVFVATPI